MKPVTPNHLLTLKSNVVLHCQATFRNQIFTRGKGGAWYNTWQTNSGNDGMQKEYNATQTRRPKWDETSENCQIGEIVLLHDKTTSRNQWPRARVTNVYPSDDGLVHKVQLLATHGDTRRIFE